MIRTIYLIIIKPNNERWDDLEVEVCYSEVEASNIISEYKRYEKYKNYIYEVWPKDINLEKLF